MQEAEQGFSFKRLFVPLTTFKAIHIIVFTGLIVFFNSVFNGFVIDDDVQIVNNPLVHSLNYLSTLFTGGTFYAGNYQTLVGYYYKPVTLAVLSFIYSLFGSSAFWFHLFQLIFHIVNSIIVFLIFKKFFNKQGISLILSLIFLVHPINSETVLYISAMQDALFFFFGILALWLIINYKSDRCLIFVGLFLFLSLLSKETGSLFMVISTAYTLFFNRKLFLKTIGISSLILITYLFLRSVTVGIFTYPTVSPIDRLSLLERLINVPAILFLYFKNFIYPIYLSSSYQFAYNKISFNNFFLPLLIDILFILLLLAFAYHLRKLFKKKLFYNFIFFGFWFTIGIFLHLQIIPLDYTAADRWFYFPMIGLLGMIGVLLEAYNFNFRKNINIFIVTILLILLSMRTVVRSFDWRDNFTLALHDLKVASYSYDLENQVGVYYLNQGKLDEAKAHIERSLALFPHYIAYNNLATVYQLMGNFSKAREANFSALKLVNNYVVYENLLRLILGEGGPVSNRDILLANNAVKKFPQDPKLWFYLAVLNYKNNSTDSAKIDISKANALNSEQIPEINKFYELLINDKPINLIIGN